MGTEAQGQAPNQVSRLNTDERQEALRNEVLASLRAWRQALNLWGTVHYATGIIGIAASAMAAASLWHPITSIVASLCFGTLGFANPQRKHYAFSNAWRVLDVARIKYEQGHATLEDVLNAWEVGERIISEGEQPSQSATQLEVAQPGNRIQEQR